MSLLAPFRRTRFATTLITQYSSAGLCRIATVTVCCSKVPTRIFSNATACRTRRRRGYRPTLNELTASIVKRHRLLQNHAVQHTRVQAGIVNVLEKHTANFEGLQDVVKQQTELSKSLIAHINTFRGRKSRFRPLGAEPFNWRQFIGRLALIILLVPVGAEYLDIGVTRWALRHWDTKASIDAAAAHVEGLKLLLLEPGTGSEPITCSLHFAKDLGQPSYECLSYRCGDQTIRKEIMCSGVVDTVGANLYAALRSLRDEKEQRVLWVDELCINQKNLVERREQVGRMGDIYSNASRVLIWLGEPNDNTQYALDTVRMLHTFFQRDKLYWIWLRWIKGGKALEHLDNDPFLQTRDWKPLQDLLSNAYFERTWIVQEIARSRDAIIFCGRETLRWSTFIHVVQRMVESEMQSLISSPVVDKHLRTLYSIWVLRIRARVNGKAGPLLDLYKSTSKFSCGDERDRLFGVLSMATDVRENDPLIRPDYALELKEVLMRFANWLVIKKQDLASLSWSRRGDLDEQESLSTEFPSWVPDNRHLTNARSMLLVDAQVFARPFSASGDKKPAISIDPNDPTALKILGRRIGHIQKTGCTLNERLRQIASQNPEDGKITALLNEDVPQSHLEIARVQAWISEAYDLARHYSPTTSTSSNTNTHSDANAVVVPPSTPSLSTALALARTSTCGLHYQSHRLNWLDYASMALLVWELRSEPELGFAYETGREGGEAGKKRYLFNPSGKLVRHFTTFGAGIRRASRAVGMWSLGRRMGICMERGRGTGEGVGDGRGRMRFVSVPEAAKEGDVVCVLYGGKVCYVLRPIDIAASKGNKRPGPGPEAGKGKEEAVRTSYRILGECYVDGMMDGEALKMEGWEDEEFVLR